VEIMNSVSALETNASSLFQDERGDLRREESEAIEERIDQEVTCRVGTDDQAARGRRQRRLNPLPVFK